MSNDLPRVYIDGQSGTTGLRIRQLLGDRRDLALLHVDPERRREPALRRELLQSADVAVLCLPDEAAREAVALAEGGAARIIDASTAHRASEGWVYGLPELAPGQRERVSKARRVANPGCYPTGAVLLLRPLLDAGLVPRDAPLTIHGLSGYTGGGNPLISRYEAPAGGLRDLPFPVPYATDRRHKHVPEIIRHAGIAAAPAFYPSVGAFACGMRIEIPLHAALLPAGASAEAMLDAFRARYRDESAIRVLDRAALVTAGALAARLPHHPPIELGEHGLDPRRCNGLQRVELTALGHPDGHVVLYAILDNLAKGASGAAVQNLNLMLGLPEFEGLTWTEVQGSLAS